MNNNHNFICLQKQMSAVRIFFDAVFISVEFSDNYFEVKAELSFYF